jgi:hypothetical protein
MDTFPLPLPESLRLFSNYLKVTGVAHTTPEPSGDPALTGKRLGLLNGSSWITLWANFFGRAYLPGVHLVNTGNEAVQMHFMEAHEQGRPTPPPENINVFTRYALDLVELARVGRSADHLLHHEPVRTQVQAALRPSVPVQIDRPMMEQAVEHGGRILVVATTAQPSTAPELAEGDGDMQENRVVQRTECEAAWYCLADGVMTTTAPGTGDPNHLENGRVGSVDLAQLSMTLFLLSYPDPVAEFGVGVLMAQWFEHLRLPATCRLGPVNEIG